MAELTLAPPVAEAGIYTDEDFRILSEEVDRIAGVVGELIASAKRQHDLIGILIDATGLAPVGEQASALGTLIPILSNMAERVADLEIRVDEADLPMCNDEDYPPPEPGHALRTYFDGWSAAEVDAYREVL